MAALATQKVITNNLVRQGRDNEQVKNVFSKNSWGVKFAKWHHKWWKSPSLCEFSFLLSFCFVLIFNFQNFLSFFKVNTIKLSIKENLTKTLTEILALQLILLLNVDGTHGKKRLKDFGHFYEALMDAVRLLYNDPDKEMRDALAKIKKPHFHAVCVGKKPKSSFLSLSFEV